MFETQQETVLKLEALKLALEKYNDGDTVYYGAIELESKITMDARGRSLLRKALDGRPYENITGEGIRLSSPDSAVRIIRGKMQRIGGAVKRAARTTAEVTERHLDKMSERDKQKTISMNAFFGAIRQIESDTRKRLT